MFSFISEYSEKRPFLRKGLHTGTLIKKIYIREKIWSFSKRSPPPWSQIPWHTLRCAVHALIARLPETGSPIKKETESYSFLSPQPETPINIYERTKEGINWLTAFGRVVWKIAWKQNSRCEIRNNPGLDCIPLEKRLRLAGSATYGHSGVTKPVQRVCTGKQVAGSQLLVRHLATSGA